MLADPIAGQQVQNGSTVLHGGDANLHVTFRVQAVRLEEQSKQAGRPVHKDVVFCRILTPGDSHSIWDQPVRDSDKLRFPRQWEAFQKGMVLAQDGTPLEQWPRMTPSKVLHYKSSNIGTVEGIAGIADSNAQGLPMDWQNDRIAAKAYLQAAADSSVVQRQAEELAERDARIKLLEGNLATLGQQMETMMSRLPAPENAAKPPRAK